MDKLTLYIWRSILVAIMLMLMLLVGIEFIFSLVNEIRFIGAGHYTTLKALIFIALTLPQQIAQLFPMATLVGTLMGLGLLASRSELIVMQQAGLSVQDIIIAVLKLALILSFCAIVLSEVIAPISEKTAHEIKALSISQGQALRTTQGVWLKDGNEFIHIQSILPFNRLEGITRYEFDEQGLLLKASTAAYAEHEQDHWILHQIAQTRFDNNKTYKEHIDKMHWQSQMSPDTLDIVGIKDLTELSAVGLWQTIAYRQQNQLDANPYILAFWQKIVRPLATLVMMFLAIPFVFGPLRSATMGMRLLVGILVGFVFFTINQLFGPLTLVYQWPPFIGALFPTAIFFMFGMYYKRKVL